VIELEILNKFFGKSSSIDGRVPKNFIRISMKISLNEHFENLYFILLNSDNF